MTNWSSRPTWERTLLLTVEQVTAGYGRLEVLHDVSLHVEEGEIVTVLGPNGTGKTTLLGCSRAHSILGRARCRSPVPS